MNFAAALDQVAQVEKANKIETVEVDGLVVLKIVKHCKENLPQLVTGQLLGLDYGGTLEVTNCFPFPAVDCATEDEMLEDGAEYQYDMMRCLREVNVDNNTVGWYQSTYLGSHINEALVATQYNYQESIPKCVCLVWDPLLQACLLYTSDAADEEDSVDLGGRRIIKKKKKRRKRQIKVD
eukprot:TRINITY_DN10039_c0_g1_i2.p1 TRINITY_DN10039_c0_g1~~TRINITY_DN10039_c0_g1_i2.p1  ORF type:complete len:180 (-),score=64.20 TRINITY_DN10039_c0_g1_i2:90-629(-)